MQSAAHSYAKTAQTALSPRELEAAVLIKAAFQLQSIKDDWTVRAGELDTALAFNRKLWTILATAASEAQNPLPSPVKQNIVRLSMFIFQRSFELITDPAPEKLSALININRELASGLRARPA